MDKLIKAYNPDLPLTRAVTPPSAWYTNQEFFKGEVDSVFSSNWLVAGRVDQLVKSGDYLAVEVAGQPVLIVKSDSAYRAFYNVCRHHAAELVEPGTGCAKALQCPYHGWTYSLEGQLKGTPYFGEVEDFDYSENGLIPIRLEIWEQWIFVCLDENQAPLKKYFASLYGQLTKFDLGQLEFHQSVVYELDCNWKVFVDNYLDGGYHVPVLHGDLNSALDCRDYKITVKDRYCLQDCPISDAGEDVSSVRSGDRAYYYWQYPNFMINLYEGVMDTNLVVPLAANRCRVHFDYYFGKDKKYTEKFKSKSIEVAHQVQLEDESICLSVQRGLESKAYDTGRLSPEKEAGEYLFHQLLYQDLVKKR